MVSQGWIDSQGQLFGVVHRPNEYELKNTNYKSPVGVILMAGFSLSMCDVDYFMSKLARHLAKNGSLVLQIDPYGHGDSEGNLEDVTVDTLRRDINTAIEYVRSQGIDKLYCAGRGLNATLMAEYVNTSKVNGVAGIAPYCLNADQVLNIWHKTKCGIYDCADIIAGRDYRNATDFEEDKLSFFYALGVRIRNLHGQKISAKIFEGLMRYEVKETILKSTHNSCWLFYDKNGTENQQIHQWQPTEKDIYLSLDTYMHNGFRRDPLWQHNVMQKICMWITEHSQCDVTWEA